VKHKDEKNVWASYLRLRVEHNVEHPIKRWIPITGKEGSKPKRYDVKYEGAPHFCFFCGIFGHNERSCMLPEEEKIVRYCEEQRASPFRHSENRSYYVPADEKKIKRSLHFSPTSSGWKCVPESENEEEEEGQAVPEQIQEVLAAAVTNLQVTDGNLKATVGEAPVVITSEQVNRATKATKERVLWNMRYKQNNKMGATVQRPSKFQAQDAMGAAGGSKIVPVPPIVDCLRSDGSLYAELKDGAAQTASAFLKKKNKVLGKRPGSEDTSMEDGSQSFVLRFRGHGGKRNKGAEGSSQEVQQDVEEKKEIEEEATSHGAAGQKP
jgi:hypothetical protein